MFDVDTFKRLDEAKETWSRIAIRLVSCPDCHAPPNAPCRTSAGRRYYHGKRAHPNRITKLNEAVRAANL